MQITLNLPETLYQTLVTLAQQQGQSPEELALHYLITALHLNLPHPQDPTPLQTFCKTLQTLPSSQTLTDTDIEAEIAAYRDSL